MIVLDASALIALLQRERGWEVVEEYFESAVLSTVNLAETLSKYSQYGGDIEYAVQTFKAASIEIVPATFAHAIDAARLRLSTKPFGLSTGDRFCFALARERNLPVLTAEHIWDKVKAGVKVIRIR